MLFCTQPSVRNIERVCSVVSDGPAAANGCTATTPVTPAAFANEAQVQQPQYGYPVTPLADPDYGAPSDPADTPDPADPLGVACRMYGAVLPQIRCCVVLCCRRTATVAACVSSGGKNLEIPAVLCLQTTRRIRIRWHAAHVGSITVC